MLSRVIALSAWKFSGKDTTATLLREYGYQPISFASALKDLVSEQYNVPREDLDNPATKESPILRLPVVPADKFSAAVQQLLSAELRSGYWTPRALCILEGSIKRSVTSTFWTARVINQIQSNPASRYVITDMRYSSEATQLVAAFGSQVELWRIHRHDSSPTDDPSERDLDSYSFDLHLSNRGSIEDLRHAVDHIMTRRLES